MHAHQHLDLHQDSEADVPPDATSSTVSLCAQLHTQFPCAAGETVTMSGISNTQTIVILISELLEPFTSQ